MYQTYNGAVKGTNIGAKGLTGEAYNGNAFWDTETYCLPFYLFNDREGAKNLLYFRYKTLDEARKRAEVLDCEGHFIQLQLSAVRNVVIFGSTQVFSCRHLR
ncbi:MAG: hypothetical protein ACLT2Z_05245 [Eubacterium sp.]